MKQRVTYIVKDASEGYDPSNLAIDESSITVSALEGAREQHLTFGLDELPAELQTLLSNSHELYVRWTSPKPYDASAPYVSRISPGLHVFFSPLKDKKAPNVCRPIKLLFGSDIKCDTIDNAFTTPPILSGRFSHSASRQFHAHVPSISTLVRFITRTICDSSHDRCKSEASELLHADYLDLDYDSISHTLVLKAFWAKSFLPSGVWREKHILPPGEHALEVGVLTNEKADEEEELKYSGFLTQVGKAGKPSAVLFSFPSRHHPLPESASFSTAFNTPTGLHPTLKVTIPNAAPLSSPPKPSCVLHTYLTLPSTLFIDRYPLSDPLFLRSHNLKALHALSGATDLEAPDYLTPAWGSAALFEIDTSDAQVKGSKEFSFTIPLHLRYLPPVNDSDGLREVPVPDPLMFWACPAEEYGKFPSSPFDRVNLGYEGLFGPKTLFYHFTPASENELVQRLQVPVLNLESAWYVEWGTVIAVLIGAVLVGFPLLKVLVREFGARLGNANEEVKKKDDKKKK